MSVIYVQGRLGKGTHINYSKSMKTIFFAVPIWAIVIAISSCSSESQPGNKEDVINVTSISLNRPSLILTVGEEETLAVTLFPNNATEKTVTWSSSSPAIAKVDGGGTVTAISEGQAEITATAGKCSVICSVVVVPLSIPATAVTIDRSSLELFVGDSETLKAIVSPENATEKTIVWSSSDDSVATVSSSGGIVNAVKEGSATIYASAGGQIASCMVSIDYHHVSDIELSPASTSLYPEEKTTISATVLPSNATYPELSWISSNNEIAVVDGGIVTAINPGKVTITASNKDKEKHVDITVLVPLISISLDRDHVTMYERTSLVLHALLNPSNANLREPLVWESSNAGVASVDKNGVVSAIKPGTAVIKVSAEGKVGVCNISVIIPSNGNEDTEEDIWK